MNRGLSNKLTAEFPNTVPYENWEDQKLKTP